jgi:hypothetical protein
LVAAAGPEAFDGFTRLAYPEALPDEQSRMAIGLAHGVRAFPDPARCLRKARPEMRSATGAQEDEATGNRPSGT